VPYCSCCCCSGAVSGAEETEAELDDDDDALAGGADGDLPAELAALVAAASADQEELPDLFKNEQLYGEFAKLCVLVYFYFEQWSE
jgi:hypothetical protein